MYINFSKNILAICLSVSVIILYACEQVQALNIICIQTHTQFLCPCTMGLTININ